MAANEPVGKFKFGGNTIIADRNGEFTIRLVEGGEWIFDLEEINKLDAILSEFERIKKNIFETIFGEAKYERTFWRTNGSKVIQVWVEDGEILPTVHLVEGGTRKGSFWRNEISQLRKNIQLLTSEGAPYGRSIRLLDVVEEDRREELVTQQQIPLNNRNSKSSLIVEREFSREARKVVSAETSFGVGIDYYISLNLETRFGINREDKISERIMVRMEAQPGEHKIYTITWKEVWITGYAVFDMGDINRREKVRFRLKSGLEPDIKQDVIV